MSRRDKDAFANNERHNRAQGLVDDGLVPREPRREKKHRAWQLENLGEALIKLSPGKLSRVPLPDDLRAAVVEAQRITARGGYRRQVQLVGKIMRTVDAVPIAEAVEALKHEGTLSSPAFRAAEKWRARLLMEGDAALTALLQERPDADATRLRQLLRQAKKKTSTPVSAATPQTSPQTTPQAMRAEAEIARLLRALWANPISVD